MRSTNSCGLFLSKCNPYFIQKFSDSTSFVVNSINGSPSPASTQISLIRNAFISCALTNFKKIMKLFTIFYYG